MKNKSTKQLRSINSLSRKLIPACWSTIALTVVIMIVGAFHLTRDDSIFAEMSLLQIITIIGPSYLIRIGLLAFMLRFFYGCCRHGIFSKVAIASIRGIGIIILISKSIKLAGLAYLIATADSLPIMASSLPSVVTSLILGVFLLVLAKILTIASGLEEQAKLTV